MAGVEWELAGKVHQGTGMTFFRHMEKKEEQCMVKKNKLKSKLSGDIVHINVIYHDFLPPPRRGSHVKADNTHTHKQSVIKIHPLAHILYT